MARGYLHFNRVDSYADFPGADAHDGQQLPTDQAGNADARFLKAPDYKLLRPIGAREHTPAAFRSRTRTTFGATTRTEARKGKPASYSNSGN